MTSSRRVKKGPGRRPQSAKRQRFMDLRARGWSVRAAAREVGVSRSAATNWARGYKTYRNGVVVGFVPRLDPFAVSQISPRYLSQDERIEIANLRRSGLSMRAIADRLGRAPSTISRELAVMPRPILCTCPSRPSLRHRTPGSPSPAPARYQCPPQGRGHRATRPAMEPTADQSPSTVALRRGSVDSVVP